MAEPEDQLYERLLVLRCQTDDAAAFAELVEHYHPRLAYYLRKLVGRETAVDDLLQNIWLDVFRGLPRLTHPAAFRRWLYRLARDRAFRELRRRHPISRPLAEENLPVVKDEEAFSAEDAASVHAALDRLAPEQREVLVLRFIESMTYEEMARVLGCPVGTVRSRLYYAKRALRSALEKEETHE